jgi:hypothetical protein
VKLHFPMPMNTLNRLRSAGILTTAIVLILAMMDMFLSLNWVDYLISPIAIAPLFVISYLVAPFIKKLIGDKS